MSLLTLYFSFMKFGLLCFGGGYMLIPLLSAELVGAPPMPLSPEEFANLLSIAQATPGPIGINTATYVGFTQQGTWGAVVATAGMLTPALILVLLAIRLLKKYQQSVWIQGFLRGMKPASFGLILSAAVIFAELSVFSGKLPWRQWFHGILQGVGINLPALAIAIVSIVLMLRTKIPFLWVMLLGGLAGALFR